MLICQLAANTEVEEITFEDILAIVTTNDKPREESWNFLKIKRD